MQIVNQPNKKILFIIFILCSISLFAQKTEFTRQDTLRGSITKERAWWDLTYYHLQVEADPDNKFLSGSNIIHYKVLEPYAVMQIDLQPPMEITKVNQNKKPLSFRREGNVYFIELEGGQNIGETYVIEILFEGCPIEAKRPPWDAALSWRKDENGNHFIATSCQGSGASTWWPCKDHMYDEPDSMLISITPPGNLTAVANGRLRSIVENKNGTKTFNWFVSNPISNYVVNMNIADYVHFSEVYYGEKGELDCDYYVLPYNLEKAKKHFQDVPRMLEVFEYWFGPYPFYEDSYKLVEVPYPGMEHQSSVTYGNHYENGFYGQDLSHTGWGFKFDFIIIHESGHEWFANNITYKDIADMWIHEGFIAYSEGLFVDFHYGKEAGNEYIIGTRENIKNDIPVIGHYNVNKAGSGDMYSKASNMLHTIRQIIDNDEKWILILRGLNEEFYHQTVTTEQIEKYIIDNTGIDFQPVFDQYLRTINIPTLEYVIRDGKLRYRWVNCIENFSMPVKIYINEETNWLKPTNQWDELKLPESFESFSIDPNFYIAEFNLRGN
ncbi:MAG: M1 family metallopeptidase [Ignavibacteria bacterium]|jgi:aminopeptidase N